MSQTARSAPSTNPTNMPNDLRHRAWHDFKDAYQVNALYGNSVFDLNTYNKTSLQPAKIAGRLASDFVNDSTRRLIWRFNHPLAITNEVGRWIGREAGFGKVYDKPRQGSEHIMKPGVYDTAKTAIAGAILTTGMDLMTGNFNLGNLGEAGRPMGYQAVLPQEGNVRQTSNVPLEYVSRYLFGRTGRLLPWNEFQKERPEISEEQYKSYRDYMRGDIPTLLGLEKVPMGAGALAGGLAGAAIRKSRNISSFNPVIYGAIAGTALTGQSAEFLSEQGIVKGTMEGIDGPEVRMLGYRIPLGAVAGTALLGAGMLHYGKRLNQGQLPRVGAVISKLSQPRVSKAPSVGMGEVSSYGGKKGK